MVLTGVERQINIEKEAVMYIISEQTKESMIEEAIQRHGDIKPCGIKETLDDCFTIQLDMILFWYNDSQDSTHIIIRHLN
jgi:hypothetical protein